jgi:V/A-type H+-transporting ATPase subunit E
MASKELIERLNREAEERVEAIRKEAAAEAEKLRSEARRSAKDLAIKCRAEEAEAVRERTAGITAKAEGEARAIRQAAAEGLAGRLRATAFSSLADIRAHDYGSTFRALAAEIPPYDWKVIRVNPADEALASEAFPGVRVVGDSGISGGLEAASEDDRVRVINTLEKRLERAWEEILPSLIDEAYEACAGD